MARKIKMNYDYILKELNKISDQIFMDILVDNFNDSSLNLVFGDIIMKFTGSKSYQENIMNLLDLIYSDSPYKNIIIKKVIDYNNKYIEIKNYNKLNIEDLEIEFAKDIIKSIANDGIAPEQMLLFLISKRDFKNEMIDFLIEQYKIFEAKVKEYEQVSIDELPEFEELLNNTALEIEMQEFYRANYKNRVTDQEFEKLAERYKVKYENGKVLIPVDLLFFFDQKMKDVYFKLSLFEKLYSILHANIARIGSFQEKIKLYFKKEQDLKDENRKLKLKNKNLQIELKQLKKLNNLKIVKNDEDKNLKDLSIQNYYLKTRIEKLEQKIADFEEEKELNTTIIEDVVIEKEEAKKIDIEFKDILILGGFWNSKTKEEVKVGFQNSAIEFIEAEKIIRNSDRISNSDLIVFDVSKNSHAIYKKVKSINNNILHISKSNLQEIEKCIER